MTFPRILVPLDGSRTAAAGLGCAAWLAERLDAPLQIVNATSHELPAREALAQLNVPQAYWPLVTLHQLPGQPEEAIATALARHETGLIVMTACGEAAKIAPSGPPDPFKIVGHVTRAVIERSPVPVVVLPPHYVEALPWQRALVPISGEIGTDAALALAVRLADALDLKVDVAHVADADASDEGLAAAARYADAPHHEYAHRLEELVSSALPHSTLAERGRIEDVALCRGDIAAELARLIERKRVSLLVVGWHGRFMTGHARVLGQLIGVIACPVLLVQPAARPTSRLKVGEEIE